MALDGMPSGSAATFGPGGDPLGVGEAARDALTRVLLPSNSDSQTAPECL